MGRNTKWIESQSDDAVDKVARRALASRIERMGHYLELSVREPQSETENVHQLRVFARRTGAALHLFEPWLPPRRGKWMSKKVKHVRRAAGDARDLDVLWMRWIEQSSKLPAVSLGLLLDEVKRRRRAAQEPIEAIYERLKERDFKQRSREFLEHVRASDEGECDNRFGCLARTALGQLVTSFFTAAEADLSDPAALHAFRIEGKQVRYAMEIFGGTFNEPFRQELYPLVVALQDRLGAINDHVTASAHLDEWGEKAESAELREACRLGREQEQTQLAQLLKEFLDWWTDERRHELRHHFARCVPVAGGDHAPPA